MVWYFLGGSIVGFILSFVVIKASIKRDGAGQLKCCQSCPYFTKGEESND